MKSMQPTACQFEVLLSSQTPKPESRSDGDFLGPLGKGLFARYRSGETNDEPNETPAAATGESSGPMSKREMNPRAPVRETSGLSTGADASSSRIGPTSSRISAAQEQPPERRQDDPFRILVVEGE
jgi:hypothetical protein